MVWLKVTRPIDWLTFFLEGAIMAKGLFATENDDLGTEVTEKLEGAAEVGAGAEVETETQAETTDIGGDAEAIEDGITAGDQLEEVQEVLTEAVDSGEGLTPVAAEGIRMAIAAICKPIHADPKRVYSLYAREGFAAESSRLANTQFALEGVGEFLKDLYKRIKAALERMWNKMKAFWEKHVSNVGRMKKAIKDMKSKVRSSKGKLKGAPFIDSVSGGLLRAFNAKAELSLADVEKTLSAHTNFSKMILTTLDNGDKAYKGMISSFASTGKLTYPLKNGENKVIVAKDLSNGRTIEVYADVESDDEGSTVDFRVEVETDEVDGDGSKGMNVASKDALSKLLDSAESLIDDTVEHRKTYEKSQDAANKVLQKLSEKVQKALEKEDNKTTRRAMTLIYKSSVHDVKLSNMASAENVRVCKAVLSYVSTSLSQYK